jgi:hypothetical protein
MTILFTVTHGENLKSNSTRWISLCLDNFDLFCAVLINMRIVSSGLASFRKDSSFFWNIMPHTPLKMETCSSEMLADFQHTTRCYIPENRTLHKHCCENLKSYIHSFSLFHRLLINMKISFFRSRITELWLKLG